MNICNDPITIFPKPVRHIFLGISQDGLDHAAVTFKIIAAAGCMENFLPIHCISVTFLLSSVAI